MSESAVKEAVTQCDVAKSFCSTRLNFDFVNIGNYSALFFDYIAT